MSIRQAKPGDEYAILELIRGLADFENASNEVENTPEILAFDLFEERICEAIVAEEKDVLIGFALFYTSYSTWKGKCLYLEDLYVIPDFRNKGVGSQLFDVIVNIAKDRKVKRMDWQVLNWNKPAILFYEQKDALMDNEWLNGRLFFNYK